MLLLFIGPHLSLHTLHSLTLQLLPSTVKVFLCLGFLSVLYLNLPIRMWKSGASPVWLKCRCFVYATLFTEALLLLCGNLMPICKATNKHRSEVSVVPRLTIQDQLMVCQPSKFGEMIQSTEHFSQPPSEEDLAKMKKQGHLDDQKTPACELMCIVLRFQVLW